MGWKNKPTNFALEIEKQAEKHVQKITGEMLQQVVTRSPVMDGEFRASHKVTIGSPDTTYQKNVDLSGNSTLQNGLAVAVTAKFGTLIYVQTNSPYGEALENGHSKQAPGGVYALAFLSVSSKYK